MIADQDRSKRQSFVCDDCQSNLNAAAHQAPFPRVSKPRMHNFDLQI